MTPGAGAGIRSGASRGVRRPLRDRVGAVELRARLVADEVDQARHAQRLAGVVHEEDERHDADEREEVRDGHGHPRHDVRPVVDAAHAEQRERERGDEQADRQLVAPVAQQGAHDARGELAHRELHGDERHRQHDARQGDHRGGDGAQDGLGVGRPAGDAARDEVVAGRRVDRDRRERQRDARDEAQQRHQPQAAADRVEEPPPGHRAHGLSSTLIVPSCFFWNMS
jgi:hypothetical protein